MTDVSHPQAGLSERDEERFVGTLASSQLSTRDRVALVERTRRFSEVSSSLTAETVLRCLRFDIGLERYAIESSFVSEVLPLKHFVSLPHVPNYVQGIVNLRGKILSIIDLRIFFQMPMTGLSDKNFLVVVKGDSNEFGLLVDRVVGSIDVDVGALQESLICLDSIRTRYLKGIDSSACIVLDGGKLLNDPSLVLIQS